LVESGNGIRNRTKLRFVHTESWRAVRGVKGLPMNGLAKQPDRPRLRSRLVKLPVCAALHELELEKMKNPLTGADDLIHGIIGKSRYASGGHGTKRREGRVPN
jgi:hypothetical protein